ncbi:putative hydroxymethylpyrimidine transporter CytX, partial [Streptococcus salivarius]|nr:putative hydroxymethylpyrimidine transporter CytX [Streptococcus salivarius]
GKEGARFFAGINVIQLIGWTAVMIVSAAAAAEIIVPLGMALWDLIIGALIALWIIMGMTTLGRVNVLVMTALFLLTAVLSGTIFGADTAAAPSGTIT